MNDMTLFTRAPLALVIDDDATVRLLAREVLEQNGLRVVDAPDGEAGLAAFRSERPDIVLLDVQMPEKDGYAVCGELRAMPEGRHLPVLMMTGLNDVESIDRAYESGSTDFITKPINWPILGYRVRYMLRASTSFEQLAKLSRIQTVLSGINSALMRIHDRAELFKEVCHIAVEHGQFRMVWIGLVEPGLGASYTRPAAWAGYEAGYLEEVGDAMRRLPDGEGAGKLALVTGKPVIVNDIASDGRILYTRQALSRGYHSLGILPLRIAEQPAGLIAFYAAETDFFTDEEIRMLTELAGDVSFALDYLAKEDKLDYLAYYDALTELPNRTLFCDRANQRVNDARAGHTSLAFLCLELDRLRSVNDTLGRQAGDHLMKLAAGRLKTVIADPNLLARTGPDCFSILLIDIRHETDALHFLERRVAPLFNHPFTVEDNSLRITAKCGIALFPNDGGDAETLLTNAGTALNKTTAIGEPYLFYTGQMNARAAGKLFLEDSLARAVQEQHFQLYYQPKVDVVTRAISGLEALIRWNDPEKGLVHPAEFVPLLEETGLILDVGTWVIRQALSDYERWRAAGLRPPRIAVNVSPVQLRHKDFVKLIAEAIGERDSKTHGLDVEVTESLIMHDIETNIPKLAALKDMQVSIAVDDFGTGYSSLAYVAKLPIDVLKIDRAFIVNMENSAEDQAIVSAISSLAHALNLDVVAEGVETETQAQLLRSLRCQQLQGYLFSPPVPSKTMEEMLAREVTAQACGPRAGESARH